MTDSRIPETPHLPIVGGTLHYFRDPLAFLENASRLGDIVKMRFFQKTAWLVTDPVLIDQVLVKSAPLFQKDMFMRSLKRLLGEGLLTSEGDFWKRQRRLIQPAFHRDRIASYASVMTERTTRALDRWKDREILDVHRTMMELTAEIVSACLFGSSAGDVGEVGRCIDVVMERFANPLFLTIPALGELPLPVNRRFREVAPRLDRIVRGFIEARRKAGTSAGSHDLLAMLLEARDDDGTAMSDQQIRDEVLVLFLAGHETTAVSLSWTLWELGENPEVEERLHEELARVLGGRVPTFDDLPKLEYTARVVSEALRLHPPAWSIRARGDERLRAGRAPLREGGLDVDAPLGDAARPALVQGPARLPPRAVGGRLREEAPEVRVHAVRRRAAHLHRQPVRPHGGGAAPGDDHAALLAPHGARPPRRPRPGHHPALQARAADDAHGEASPRARVI